VTLGIEYFLGVAAFEDFGDIIGFFAGDAYTVLGSLLFGLASTSGPSSTFTSLSTEPTSSPKM